MPDLLRLSILTPERAVLTVAGVRTVRLKLADHGWLSIYPRHAPLLAETLAGHVTYTTDVGVETLFVSEGILQIAENEIALFTGGVDPTVVLAVSSEEDVETARFDRLANVLLLALNAHPADLLGEDAVEIESELA